MLDPQLSFRQMAIADFKETATPKEAVPGSLYARGFDFDDTDEERPYTKAGQRYHYNDAIIQVKLERM